ncbi:MAG: hypothetical protein HQK79_17870 [Desulfobacterales bacterium]|nr:hypothetical protein [Desulfobacterales bacterium]
MTGTGADIENIVFEKLQEYNHHRLSSNLERILENLKSGGKFCNSSISKNPDREKFAYYSIPEAIIPPIHIFIRKEDHAAFGGKTTVYLKHLLENKKLKFGYPTSRSHGNQIDQIIKAYEKEPNVLLIYSSDITSQAIELLKNKRIDYTICGYLELKMAAQKQGVEDEIIGLRIDEKLDYLVLYFVAPKTDWGKNIIDKIDAILRKEIPTQRYFNCFKPFYDDFTKEEFKKQYEKLLVNPILK